MTIQEYIKKVGERYYKTGIAREQSYRGDLELLINAIKPEVVVTNDGARIAYGAPDYIITKKQIPIGYYETNTKPN